MIIAAIHNVLLDLTMKSYFRSYSLYITLVRCMLLQHWFNSRMYGIREVLIMRLPPTIYRPTNDHRPI